mgnify:CR=1 FL=1
MIIYQAFSNLHQSAKEAGMTSQIGDRWFQEFAVAEQHMIRLDNEYMAWAETERQMLPTDGTIVKHQVDANLSSTTTAVSMLNNERWWSHSEVIVG